MRIELDNLGKRFKKEWIFKGINAQINPGITGITGHNGSGKSTLLKIISQAELPSTGKVVVHSDNSIVPAESVFKMLSYASPYMEVTEAFSISEILKFHLNFQSFLPGIDSSSFQTITQLSNTNDKAISQYSSGMKQRLKLGLALLSDTPIVLLDEPCSNLDEKGVSLYQELIQKFGKNRTIIIASNEVEKELKLMQFELSIPSYK